jgi:hypothetical protein
VQEDERNTTRVELSEGDIVETKPDLEDLKKVFGRL